MAKRPKTAPATGAETLLGSATPGGDIDTTAPPAIPAEESLSLRIAARLGWSQLATDYRVARLSDDRRARLAGLVATPAPPEAIASLLAELESEASD